MPTLKNDALIVAAGIATGAFIVPRLLVVDFDFTLGSAMAFGSLITIAALLVLEHMRKPEEIENEH